MRNLDRSRFSRSALLPRARKIRALSLALPLLVMIALLLPGSFSCTSEKIASWEAKSLDEAKSLASQHKAVILVDFWKRH